MQHGPQGRFRQSLWGFTVVLTAAVFFVAGSYFTGVSRKAPPESITRPQTPARSDVPVPVAVANTASSLPQPSRSIPVETVDASNLLEAEQLSDSATAPLRQALRSTDPGERIYAVRTVDVNSATVGVLRKLLEGEQDLDVQREVFHRLEQSTSPAARALVVDSLGHAEEQIVDLALDVVEEWLDPDLAPELAALTNHSSSALAERARFALEDLNVYAALQSATRASTTAPTAVPASGVPDLARNRMQAHFARTTR